MRSPSEVRHILLAHKVHQAVEGKVLPVNNLLARVLHEVEVPLLLVTKAIVEAEVLQNNLHLRKLRVEVEVLLM